MDDIGSYYQRIESRLSAVAKANGEPEPQPSFDAVRRHIDDALALAGEDVAAHLSKAVTLLDGLRKNYEGPTPVPSGAEGEVMDQSTVEEVATPAPTTADSASTSFSSNEPAMGPPPAPPAPTGQVVPPPARPSGAPFASPNIGKSFEELEAETSWPPDFGRGGKKLGFAGVE